MRRKTSRAKRRTQRRPVRPAVDPASCFLLATFEIDGQLVHRVVSEIPEDDAGLLRPVAADP
jgi:hypothetical protein